MGISLRCTGLDRITVYGVSLLTIVVTEGGPFREEEYEGPVMGPHLNGSDQEERGGYSGPRETLN